MTQKEDLILGAATGYQVEQMHMFLQSLVRIGFCGQLVLFIHKKEEAVLKKYLNEQAPSLTVDLVCVRSIREHIKWTRSCIKRLFSMLPAEVVPELKRKMLKFHGRPHVARYFHYADYLAGCAGCCHVLLSDVRDVVFQEDPFKGVTSGLYLGMESDELTIATEPFDRDWILDAYGEDVLRKIGDMQISCSGVTLGDLSSIRRYVDLIIRESLGIPFRKMKKKIYDQAFHNKLLHFNELGQVKLCQPLESRIATLGCMKTEKFVLSDQGHLLNMDGTVASIVHQYDRHDALVSAFKASL